MKLYFECNMGAAGDMIVSALTDLFENRQEIITELNSLGLPHTLIKHSSAEQGGMSGSKISVIIAGEEEQPQAKQEHPHHAHTAMGFEQIHRIINTLKLSDKVKKDVIGIYDIVALAEAKAHRLPPGEVHFHELGMRDAIADITMAAYLINKLQPERILTSPINVGNGTVRCAHGILPVPAPATANILMGVPYYKSDIFSELCTPTGAAILKYYTDEFTANPDLSGVTGIGIGCGTKRFEQANILRVFASESNRQITELSCNVDDMTGEETAFAMERILAEGALDCFVSPVMMKKGRPAYVLSVLCKSEEAQRFAALVFKHTTTIGIRKYTPSRYTLERVLSQESGVHLKRSEGYGAVKQKIEFEDIKALALREDISAFEARERLKKRYEK